MYSEARYHDQLDEVFQIAQGLNVKITGINQEVRDQNNYLDKMREELNITKKNMDAIKGNFENLRKAMGRVCLKQGEECG